MKLSTLLCLGLALGAGPLVANDDPPEDPFSPAPRTEAERKKEEKPFDILKIRVTIEKEGKEAGSYTAYASDNGDGELFCSGAIKLPQGGYWNLYLEADLDPVRHSTLRLDVKDLNLFHKNGDGEIEPVEIFVTRMQSKGLGDYLCGELQGFTLRVVLSKPDT